MNLTLQELADQLSHAFARDPLLPETAAMAGRNREGESIGCLSLPSHLPMVGHPTPGSPPDVAVLPGQADPAVALLGKRGFASEAASGVVQMVDYARRGYHLEATVLPSDVVHAAALLDQGGFALDTITGVDWIAEGEMEVVYDYFHATAGFRVVIRSRIPRSNPELPTISDVFPGANWHERETHDFFGIRFLGHPDLTPFLLPEDAEYHPLRKDFTA
jgi:NADH-quinone oxidoreductase subunit C